jgi:hypothetical protein
MLRTEKWPALNERLFTFEVRIAQFSFSVTVKFALTAGTDSLKPNSSLNQVIMDQFLKHIQKLWHPRLEKVADHHEQLARACLVEQACPGC